VAVLPEVLVPDTTGPATLPKTGSNTKPVVVLGAGLVAFGAVLVLSGRRRRAVGS
jgi:LPXTG-motif cell wall-anchored protein